MQKHEKLKLCINCKIRDCASDECPYEKQFRKKMLLLRKITLVCSVASLIFSTLVILLTLLMR